MRDPNDIDAHEAEAAAQAQAAEFQRNQWQDDIKWLMGHSQGRRIATRLLEESGVFRTSFHTSGSVMAHQEGRKHVGYFLTGELLEIAPERYFQLLKEYRT
jgi:hypothetical protein